MIRRADPADEHGDEAGEDRQDGRRFGHNATRTRQELPWLMGLSPTFAPTVAKHRDSIAALVLTTEGSPAFFSSLEWEVLSRHQRPILTDGVQATCALGVPLGGGHEVCPSR